VTRLRHLPFIGQFFDEKYLAKHRRVMSKIKARDTTHPITLEDKYFGTFSYTRGFSGGRFELRRHWGEHMVRLTLDLYEGSPEPDMEKAADLARSARIFWNGQPDWERKMKAAVFDEFYDDIDEDENDPNVPSLSPQEFLDNITFDKIDLSLSGKFEAWASVKGLGECCFAAVKGSVSGGELNAEYHG